MRSVADELREETRRELSHMTPAARLELSFSLGDADVAAVMAARGLSERDARALIARSRRAGRRPSCLDAD
jgi:hypothetical protein